MKSCIHKIVCKHKPVVDIDIEECSLKDVCKFISDGNELPGTIVIKPKRKYKKRNRRELPLASATRKKDHKGRKRSDHSHLTISDEDICRAKQILNLRQIRGSLNPNQSAALDMYKDTKVKELKDHQRQQILDILKDISKEEENQN